MVQNFAEEYGLKMPGYNDLGAIGAFLGLFLIIKTKNSSEEIEKEEKI